MIDFYYHIANYIQSGGVVMLPILMVSCSMWVLIFNRVWFMRGLYEKNMPRKEAGLLIKENRLPESHHKGINSLLVRDFLSNRSMDPELDDYILDESVLRVITNLNKYLSIITMLSTVAPLLGLLGTVVGMMHTFDVIMVFGTGNSRAMAGGISVALITTQTGLMVSIPGLYMSGWLQRRAQNLKNRAAGTGIYLKRFI